MLFAVERQTRGDGGSVQVDRTFGGEKATEDVDRRRDEEQVRRIRGRSSGERKEVLVERHERRSPSGGERAVQLVRQDVDHHDRAQSDEHVEGPIRQRGRAEQGAAGFDEVCREGAMVLAAKGQMGIAEGERNGLRKRDGGVLFVVNVRGRGGQGDADQQGGEQNHEEHDVDSLPGRERECRRPSGDAWRRRCGTSIAPRMKGPEGECDDTSEERGADCEVHRVLPPVRVRASFGLWRDLKSISVDEVRVFDCGTADEKTNVLR